LADLAWQMVLATSQDNVELKKRWISPQQMTRRGR